MAKAKRVDYARVNRENVAIGQKVVNALGDSIGYMTDLAIHCNNQFQEIAALKKENQELRKQLAG